EAASAARLSAASLVGADEGRRDETNAKARGTTRDQQRWSSILKWRQRIQNAGDPAPRTHPPAVASKRGLGVIANIMPESGYLPVGWFGGDLANAVISARSFRQRPPTPGPPP